MASLILIVDDEPAVVELASAVLTRKGYRVRSATDPHEAYRLAISGAAVDLILSDVMMPEMNGPELIRKVRECVPSVAAVLMSGYTREGLPDEIPLVQKPFTPSELVEIVSQTLQHRVS